MRLLQQSWSLYFQYLLLIPTSFHNETFKTKQKSRNNKSKIESANNHKTTGNYSHEHIQFIGITDCFCLRVP